MTTTLKKHTFANKPTEMLFNLIKSNEEASCDWTDTAFDLLGDAQRDSSIAEEDKVHEASKKLADEIERVQYHELESSNIGEKSPIRCLYTVQLQTIDFIGIAEILIREVL